MTKEYTDFTDYPEGLLTEGKNMDSVKIRGIARACDNMIYDGKDCVAGMLELDKGKFIEIYGRVGTMIVKRVLQTSSETNQEIQVKGVYNKSDKSIFMHSLKLGNLEEIALPTWE